MRGEKVVKIIKNLNLPKGHYVVFGGSTLAIRNLRDAQDIDLFITDKLYTELLQNGWRVSSSDSTKNYLLNYVEGIEIQAYKRWQKEGWQPNFKDYLKTPEVFKGIPLMPLAEMRKWKEYTARQKDLLDVKLIDDFWSTY